MTTDPAGRTVPAEALEDALDGMEDMISYVPEYFADKWKHPDYIERAKAALAAAQEVEVQTHEEWAALRGPYTCGPQLESWTWEMHGHHPSGDEHGPWLAHRRTVTTHTSRWVPAEREGEGT